MTHGGNTVADSELIMNYLTNTYLSHEKGAAGGVGARPSPGYLAFPAMTPEQQARRCVQHKGNSRLCLRVMWMPSASAAASHLTSLLWLPMRPSQPLGCPADRLPSAMLCAFLASPDSCSTLVRVTVDEHLYWGLVYYNWVKDEVSAV
jgi:hypothetical protein